jgi:glycosyltransferase involved in cell wall biosynthesis
LPLVSVILPTRDRYDLSVGAIDNVLQQTIPEFEIIVIEDGSKCGIKDYINKLNDNRLYYYSHNRRKGLAAARNSGTRFARGKYVAFMDDDERWLNDKLELQYNLIKNYDLDEIMIYCGNLRMDNNGNWKEYIPSARGKMLPQFFNGYIISSSCIMIKRSIILSLGGHSENLMSCIDHDFWLKLSHADFKMDYVPKGLVYTVKHNHMRMMDNTDERIKGIMKFFNKWKNIVKREAGENAWQKIEDTYHIQTSRMLVKKYKEGRIQKRNLIVEIQNLFDIQQRSFSWLDVFLIRYGKIHLTPIYTSKIKFIESSIRFIKRNFIEYKRKIYDKRKWN